MFAEWFKPRVAARKKAYGKNARGTSMVEFALIAPWFVFLFIGAFDYGFYSYALIATQNAARVVAMYCSTSSSRAASCSACTYATNQLANMPNMSGVTTCDASPLVLTTSVVNVTNDSSGTAAQASVVYTTPALIPIPGLLPGTITITRTAVMRVQS